ncbi:MAG: hypothetical protein HYT75_01045 [Deltaproteobacteria bacterium]|nr:hypothetical protein [Deltaproteobacteria bacterium]
MNKIRRYKNDWIVIAGILLVLSSIYGTMIYEQRMRLHEEALISELRSLRIAVAAFHIINGRNPRDFNELSAAVMKTADNKERRFLPSNIIKRDFMDVFGNPYVYDPSIGWVRCTTSDYSDW